MKKDTFANRLQIALNDNGFKQIDLVNKTKLDKTLINKYLSGISEPKQDKLEIIAEALGVNEVWLMGYNVPKKPLEEPFGIDMINDNMGENYISTVQLSIMTKVEYNEINNIISGKTKVPKPSILKKIADALNQDFYDYLIGFGYVEDPENMHNNLYDSGIRYLLDFHERLVICDYLSSIWNNDEEDNFKENPFYRDKKIVYTPKKVYDVIFNEEKTKFSNEEVQEIINYNNYKITGIESLFNAPVIPPFYFDENTCSEMTLSELKKQINNFNKISQNSKETLISMLEYFYQKDNLEDDN